MTQKKFERKHLKELLLENECTVTFTKVNGDIREMPCTLDPTMMPEPPEVKEGKETKKENLAVLNVWCTDKKGWRSFRVENVTDITIIDQIK